jgi:uncharacterized membrane protein YeaQ/YmgE (transglycosylase-associated protein family)
MNLNTALIILLVGAVAGVTSGLIAKAKGKSFHLAVHLVVGIIGALHGRLYFGLIGVSATSTIGHIIFAGIGAVLFLYPLRFIKPN